MTVLADQTSWPNSMDDVEIHKLLGKGGYGSVYLVKYQEDFYALKIITKASLVTKFQQQQVFREKFALNALVNEPFIIHLHHTFKDEKCLYFLMEYSSGTVLYRCIWDSYLETRDARGHLDLEMTQFLAAQVVLAIQAIQNKGYCHRDLKSGNILVDKATGYLHVIDFGFAKPLHDEKETQENQQCGTHYVMAPEIIKREKHGSACDMWALGVLLYEMYAGRPPWPYKPDPIVGKTVEESNQVYLNGILDTVRMLQFPASLFDESTLVLQDLIRALLTENPSTRMGSSSISQIMEHPFFAGINWETLRKKTLKAPSSLLHATFQSVTPSSTADSANFVCDF